MAESDWTKFCREASRVMHAALENEMSLIEANAFFVNDRSITDPDLRRYVECMIWEIDGNRYYFMELLEMFDARCAQDEIVRMMNG